MWNRKSERNRGASLVSVVIAMAVVAVLGVSAIVVTYSNLNRKLVESRAKNNAYTAETAVDEIVAGLQTELSLAFDQAYSHVMAKYGTYSTSAEMQQDFGVNVITALVESIHQKKQAATSGSKAVKESYSAYSLPLLKSYVSSDYSGSLTISSSGTNSLETLASAVVLRNVKVTYVENGYENSIVTDVRIDVPKMNFTKVSSMPNLGEYANIAEGGIILKSGTTLTLDGQAYAGKRSSSSPYAIHLETNCTLNLKNCDLLVAKSYIDSDTGGKIYTGTNTSLWATYILANKNNTFEFLGNTYVQDDITLQKTGAKLKLGGAYFGLSDGDTADESSAIIVNGRGSTIDMSKLQTLVLMGTAYVSGSSAKGTIPDGVSGGNTDVKTGESIAVKSNQLAYLVPTECEGIVSNPMSYDEYKELTNNGSDTAWVTKALETKIPSLGTTVKSYGDVSITPVFTPEQGGSVYLYLNFSSSDAAAAYFLDMYRSSGATGAKLREYLPQYLKNFSFPVEENSEEIGLTRLVTEGNYLLPGTFNTDTLKWEGKPNYSSAVSLSGNISNELENYRTMYKALCTKLVTSTAWLSEDELKKTVYKNVVNYSKISSVIKKGSGTASNGAEITDVVMSGTSLTSGKITFTGSNNTKAIIVYGDYILSGDTESATGGIIIATGNVYISRDWEGVIICGGRLEVKGNAKITANASRMGEALRLRGEQTASGKTSKISVASFFVGGADYIEEEDYQQDDDNTVTSLSECVYLQNWRSE